MDFNTALMTTPSRTTAGLASLFVPHGAPTFALQPGAAGAALAAMAARLPRPRAVVIVSAHWDTAVPTVGAATRFDTIHDFSGFPPALRALRYPATGCPELARSVAGAIEAAGLPVQLDTTRGLDHGAWVPLRLMYPDADVPVIALSIQSTGGPDQAWRLGRALSALQPGLLVIGSGNLTHNLRDWHAVSHLGADTPGYVRGFAEWVAEKLSAGDTAALIDYRRRASGGVQAHPSEEHLLPLFVALGAAGDGAPATRFHAGIDEHVLAMDAWSFTPALQGDTR
ncbi:MAG: class III extradiol ring-cleavage dioxygenase [Methyloversatilis sp.]|uniref:DODA-type extradiol aromatic ring-opening family dioxygenase n=2 Tax=Methyloversatilis sp. TaxID=2569862 RepID=UPI0027376B49|nr:class III extradiol ring-cleavage dioxygenase [Methyloversatilis sp.]MDP2867452.1 class III extradiol ring-cleavage dioxygenase [Methyloversatilis sp.]MDP3455049.1 class III extradiol ring-cleavage dioxygenase [Methyloversatilis sp.]MDP3578794.1 class III extradiol ring-cleavage dioxygenase [Methyloversatilis sp.]